MNLVSAQKIFLSFLVSGAIISCAPAATKAAPWIPFSRGLPTHAPILSLATDPRDPNKIYAGAYAVPGAYLSTDQARSWRPFADGLGNVPVLTLQFINADLFAGTTNGLFRLRDERWTRVENVPPVSIYSISRGNDGAFYLATDRRGIYATNDAGKTWTLLPGLDGEILLSVAVLDTETIFVGTGGRGAFVTRDRGKTWHALDLFTGDYVSFIVIDPRDQQTIFLRTRWGLFRSRYRGVSWELLQGGIENGIVNALLIDSHRIYAASSAGVLASDDDGAAWHETDSGLPKSGQPLAFAQIGAQTILVGMQTGVYLTHDAGASWHAANQGLGAAEVHALALKKETNALIAATEDGLYESDPNGDFHFIGNDAMHWPMLSVAIAPSNPQKIYAGSFRRGIYLSNDGGKTWDSAGDIFRGRLAAPGLAVNPGDAQIIFARVLFQRIYKSDDGGETWRAVWTGMSDDTEVETMVIAPSDPAVMWAGTNLGVFISRDGGESWTPRGLSDNSSRWASYRNVFAVWIDPRDPRQILAGATEGLYRSDDAGEKWMGTGLAHITITAIVRDARGNFYAGTKYSGVWISRDNVKTWERFGTGLDDVSVNALVVDDARAILYVATTRGVFQANLIESLRRGAR